MKNETQAVSTLEIDQLSAVGGGIAPLALAAAVVTTPGFIKFSTTVSLIAIGMDLATDLIER